jgi:D-xylose 1-dehydrogenase (NADP+, D-xylono-1,5-lactone-forming)
VSSAAVRWGFIGAGYVATRAMGPAVHTAQGAVLQAVASRDPQRSAVLEPVRVHDRYLDLIDDPDIDAVYISLRNGQHKEWVERALQAGRHVLCEKPLALDAAEAQAMFATAQASQRLLVEAVWMRWHPRFQRMIQVVLSGALGPLTSISSAFTFTGTDMAGNYRLDPTQGGGALMDVGCYQTHTWLALLGHDADHPVDFDITDVTADMGPTGVDLTTSVTGLLHTSGSPVPVTGRQISSFALPDDQHLEVRGQHAVMSAGAGETFTNWKAPSSLRLGDTEEHFAPTDPFQIMVEAVSARIAGDDADHHDRVPALDSLRAAEILDQIRVAAHT